MLFVSFSKDCVWIGQDVGAKNHKVFFLYLTFSVFLLLFDVCALAVRGSEIAYSIVFLQSWQFADHQLRNIILATIFGLLYVAACVTKKLKCFIYCFETFLNLFFLKKNINSLLF